MASLDSILKPQPERPILTEDYAESNVPCSLITGPAGTGKTTGEKRKIEEDPSYGQLCATTGIAAINLGPNVNTLNSVLKFFDTDSLEERFNRGFLTSTLGKIGRMTKKLVIDEVSMMDGRQLDFIYQAMTQANDFDYMQQTGPIGIVLTGDFCQLPPVKAPWAFQADCWEHFERHKTVLTKNYRQGNETYQAALLAARGGNGVLAAQLLQEAGVKFIPATNPKFDGSTILSKNQQVDNYNFSSLMRLPGIAYSVGSYQWGTTASEWKNIPDLLKLKDGALVMILSNSPADTPEEERYANGDTGHVVSKDQDSGAIIVRLVRNGAIIPIFPIIRHKSERDPAGYDHLDPDESEHIYCDQKACGVDGPGKRSGEWGVPSYNCAYGTWNTGAIKYYPIRLAYATTVHKSQGLTLDNCQVDCRDPFFGSPSMAYVALSRCRTPEGLVVVGTPEKLAERIKADPKVKRWL
jgi:ATP-dependent DNA helicase PIF1